jgi:thiamine biosynthesis lipoprotein
MGGPWQLRHVPIGGVAPDDVAQIAFAALQRVDQQMTTYCGTSDLMRISLGPVGEWLDIPADLHTVMSCATALTQDTDGAINIALGDAVNAWGFGPDDTPDVRPETATQRAIAARAAIGGYALRADPPAVWKSDDIRFDLSSIAKGFAVDRAAQVIRDLGVTDFLIEAAGEVFAQGTRPDGAPWRIGLELPGPDETVIFDEIALDTMAAATSGGYRNQREIDGALFGHTLNPTTGNPIQGDLMAVTVLDPSCMRADALATALYVLGAQDGPKFADTRKVAALFLIRTPEGFREIRSETFVAQT